MYPTATGIAILIERRALALGLWAYTPITPILPGVGVSLVPIIQLLLITPAAFLLAEWAVSRRIRDY